MIAAMIKVIFSSTLKLREVFVRIILRLILRFGILKKNARIVMKTIGNMITIQISITNLIDENQCYETIRRLRWSDGIKCPFCSPK